MRAASTSTTRTRNTDTCLSGLVYKRCNIQLVFGRGIIHYARLLGVHDRRKTGRRRADWLIWRNRAVFECRVRHSIINTCTCLSPVLAGRYGMRAPMLILLLLFSSIRSEYCVCLIVFPSFVSVNVNFRRYNAGVAFSCETDPFPSESNGADPVLRRRHRESLADRAGREPLRNRWSAAAALRLPQNAFESPRLPLRSPQHGQLY